MKYLAFVLTLSSLLSDSHADIRPDWNQLYGTEALEIYLIETDGRRLYAYGNGVYISLDDGHSWRLTGLENAFGESLAIDRNTVYAGTSRGIFRSDNRGITWKPINNGIRVEIWDDDEISYPRIRQILVTRSGTVIAVGYHAGTYISTNRGETWHGTDEWRYIREHLGLDDVPIGYDIWSMTEFDGYWWAVTSSGSYKLCRSSDDGETWEGLPYWVAGGSIAEYPHVVDWAVLDDRLYVAGAGGLGRWNEAELAWDDLSQGLPPERIESLAVNRERIFAGLRNSGVWMFDVRSETWIHVGLREFSVAALVSHQSDLYAVATDSNWDALGIYRASIPIVQPYGKSAITWGALKTK